MIDSLSLENLEDYILRFQNHKDGSYEYDQIRSIRHVKKTVEEGKKVVFLKSRTFAKYMFIMGSIFLILGLVIAIILSAGYSGYYRIITFSIGMGIPSAVALSFFIVALRHNRLSFLVLGAEGIAYKLPQGIIKGYNWEDIKMDFYNFLGISEDPFRLVEIHITMPNEDVIRVSPQDYECKEIPINMSIYVGERKFNFTLVELALYMYLFKAYFDYGKNRIFETKVEGKIAYSKDTKDFISEISTNMITNNKDNDDTKAAYVKYKKKNYRFGKYQTRDQIQAEYLRKKIFVLKGGVDTIIWVIVLFPLILVLSTLILGNLYFKRFQWFEVLLQLVLVVSIWSALSPFLIVNLIKFLVVGPSGVHYRKILGKGFFLWNNVYKIEVRTRSSFSSVSKEDASVTIHLINGKTKKFQSNFYKNKEFSKKVYSEMFLNLFYVYFNLGKKSTS